MPRRKQLHVEPWPLYDSDTVYPAKVDSITWSSNGKTLAVKLIHLLEAQAGRSLDVLLPLPVRPENLTAGFLRAAGLAVAVNGKVDPYEAIGTVVLMTLEVNADGEANVSSFHPPVEADE